MPEPTPTAPVRVEARGWGWRHAGRGSWAVTDATFTIEPGERVLLLGASGAGKSTLLAGLAGVLGGADEGDATGELLLDGLAAPQQRGRAGLVLQDPDSQVVSARVGDDVAFGCENLAVPRDEIWPRVRAALDAVDLRVPLDRRTEQLSGGQRQRLVLAGILAMQPGLLLLDEPTANLDPQGVAEVRGAVARAVEDRRTTLVVVEHHVEIWADLVDRVIVLGPGGVLADGVPDQVFAAQGASLAAAGVWVPGIALPTPLAPAGPAEAVLSAHDLTVGYDRARPVRTFDSLALERGRSTVITGPNGAGKSTLAMTLAGLLAPLAGAVEAASDLAAPRRRGAEANPARWRSRELLTRIGTVFQTPEHQFVAATVRAELAIGLQALKLPAAVVDERVDELLERLRLARYAEAHPFTLSGGEKRRLSVATVLATGPQVLILDEPTFGQDAATWRELVALVAQLRADGHTIVSITHDAAYIATLGERRLDLGAGPDDVVAGVGATRAAVDEGEPC